MSILRVLVTTILFIPQIVLQAQTTTTENPLSAGITVSAFVPGIIPPVSTIYYIPPNEPMVNGVPVTVQSGSDVVILKGIAYPKSIVTLLKNGLIIDEVPSNPNGSFEIRLRNLNPSTYTFGVRAQDENGNVSRLETFTVLISSNITTVIDGIFVSPTITTNMIEVAWGGAIIISGMSAPGSGINILINAKNKLLKKVTANDLGYWSYNLDSQELEIGDHSTQARSIIKEDVSSLSLETNFIVGSKNKERKSIQQHDSFIPICDLNKDARVNLSDFSIMAYWYKRDGFPPRVDLNGDFTIDLIDFSILAYCWTG